ncbi:MAG TPA: undecaprenyl-phosphate galactose phosphotransferase WbaP [Thermodesulfovibrionales bacterium]|nr:undecaprenyl-phosphate galactose phosphotransferase WbaP [Thermodesulfovibrionales bacterium]
MRATVKLFGNLLKVICLVVIDLLAFYTSLFIAWAVRSHVLSFLVPDMPDFRVFTYSHFLSFWWIPAIFVFFLFYEDLYERNLPFWDEARINIKAVSLATLTVMAIVTLGKMQDRISRIVLLGIWVVALFAFPLFRLWGKRFLYRVGVWRERALILGAGNAGRLVMEGLQREKHMGYDVIGFLDDDETKRGQLIHGKRVFGRVRHFPKFIRELNIVTVIIAMPSLSPDRLSRLTASVQNHSSNTMVIPDLRGIALLNTGLVHLFYEEIFLMNIRNNLKSAPNRFVKRLFDIVVSVVSLPLLLPAIGIIGTVIRLETPGPAIYAHDRIGKGGKTFRCYKFRTMQKDAEERLIEMLENNAEVRNEWEKNWKLKEDPRTTMIGRFLRKTSLDELPQIFNVIKGEMSFVGPRPYLIRERSELEEHLHVIGSTEPGITGLWQVSGRSNTGYEYRLKLDAWYVMNWSLWLDIAILFKTIRVVARREGAY